MDIDSIEDPSSSGLEPRRMQQQIRQRSQGRMGNQIEEMKEEFKQQNGTRFGATINREQRESRSFLDTMVTNRVYNYSFQTEMVERLDFLRFLVA